MKDDNVVISFAEKIEAKKKEKELKNSVDIPVELPAVVAQQLYEQLSHDIARQKENVEIWTETLYELLDDCDMLADVLNLSSFLRIYSNQLLEEILNDKFCKEDTVEQVALSFVNSYESTVSLCNKIDKIIKKGE